MRLYLCCLVFKLTDDYNDDDDAGDDDGDGSGLRRSSCRGAQTIGLFTRSRKGALWMFNVAAAE